ncbi:thioesterase family protein [Pseudomonas sp. F1_0610]|uniref:acyl-CoA thioesterase n=1 Tax=Pseudomonas sp. F1_0610 TaxID=3114284 RepID=UPI0039C3664F
MNDVIQLSDFPHQCHEKLRFRDTDMQGHVNNSVYLTLFEQARIEVLFNQNQRLDKEGAVFVVAHISMDFLNELLWPNDIVIGSSITQFGRSSMHLTQAIFQGETCIAKATSVIVLMDVNTRRSTPFSDFAIEQLTQLQQKKTS